MQQLHSLSVLLLTMTLRRSYDLWTVFTAYRNASSCGSRVDTKFRLVVSLSVVYFGLRARRATLKVGEGGGGCPSPSAGPGSSLGYA